MRNWLAQYGPISICACIALLGTYFLSDYLSFETLRENRAALIAYRDAHYGLAVVLFVIFYVTIVAFSLPGATVATLTGGFLFGLAVGGILNILSATVGAICIFLAARHGFGEMLTRRIEDTGGLLSRIRSGLDHNEWSMLFLIRLMPIVPFFVANLVPALLNVALWRFAVSTFFGIIPAGLVYTSVGVGLGEVFAQGETPNLGIIFEPYVIWPILGLSALATLPIVIKALQARKEPQS